MVITKRDTLPSTAGHEVVGGTPQIVWCYADGRYAELEAEDGIIPRSEAQPGRSIMDVLEERGYDVIPAEDLPGPSDRLRLSDAYHRRHSSVFAYRFIAPQRQQEGIRQFVAASFGGRPPASWANSKLTADGRSHTHTLFHFRATYSVARSMGSSQAALEMLAELPSDVAVVQSIAAIDGFSGWQSQSQLPTPREEQLYQPGQVYQLLAPPIYDPTKDAGEDDPRGTVLTDDDILTAYGLEPLNG